MPSDTHLSCSATFSTSYYLLGTYTSLRASFARPYIGDKMYISSLLARSTVCFFFSLSRRSLRLDTFIVCFSVFVHYYGQHAACNHYVTFTNPCEHMLTAGFQSVPMWAFFDSALSVSQSMHWQPSHRCSQSPLCDRMRRSWHGCSCVRCLVRSAPSIVNALLLPPLFQGLLGCWPPP